MEHLLHQVERELVMGRQTLLNGNMGKVVPFNSRMLGGGLTSANDLKRSYDQVVPIGSVSNNIKPSVSKKKRRTCEFPTCSKGSVSSTRFCVKHGGGKRCQHSGCVKGAISTTKFCRAHGGGRRCQHEGCPKSAISTTKFCVGHGGGRRCSISDCSKGAIGSSSFCARHGGGFRCTQTGCNKFSRTKGGKCTTHLPKRRKNNNKKTTTTIPKTITKPDLSNQLQQPHIDETTPPSSPPAPTLPGSMFIGHHPAMVVKPQVSYFPAGAQYQQLMKKSNPKTLQENCMPDPRYIMFLMGMTDGAPITN